MPTPSDEMLTRLAAIETLLAMLVEQREVREWYSTSEVAVILGKALWPHACSDRERKRCGCTRLLERA